MHAPTGTYYVQAVGEDIGYIVTCSDTFAALLRTRGFMVREGK